MEDILGYMDGFEFFGNSAKDYLLAVLLFLLIWLGIRLFKRIVVFNVKKLVKKTTTKFDDKLVEVLDNINAHFYFAVSVYFPLRLLVENPTADLAIRGVFLVIVVLEVIKVLQKIIEIALTLSLETSSKKAANETTVAALSLVVKMVLWVTGVLLILSNLGFNINSLVASLGIGGVAIALAMQSILADMFSSFSIYFDKPFEVGDFIMIGKDAGKVTKIGLKTTRLTTLQGEELVISNQELTSARVQNFKKMIRRRPEFNFGVTYETSAKKLRKISVIVGNIISNFKTCEFDRCSFIGFGDFSLNFKVVYFVDSPEIKDFESNQQEINIQILEAFEKEGIEMAYPTQKVYVEKG